MQELGIKKDTYYGDLSYLKMKAAKDENGKSYLTNEQAELIRQLRSYVTQAGKREGFANHINHEIKADLVHQSSEILPSSEEDDLEILPSENRGSQQDYLEVLSTEDQFQLEDNLEQLVYEAAQIKMQNLATPHLVKLHLAQQMSEEDLPPEMREKLQEVREAANRKSKPASVIANNLLDKWRRSGKS